MNAISAKFNTIVFLAVLTLMLALALLGGCTLDASAPVTSSPTPTGTGEVGYEEDWPGDVSGFDETFQLNADPKQSGRGASLATVMDKALRVVGLPGVAGTSDGESLPASPGVTTMTPAERYRHNPHSPYGAQSFSPSMDIYNVSNRLFEQALSAGSSYFSSWAEGWLSGYGKARINVRVNSQGEISGSGDFLYPIYDSDYTTFFNQIGLRTMTNDRVIGNFGLGQRFFPAEHVALGYNVFLDQDFSRNHTRGGAGVEAWFDWLRVSANYYTPLSGWKDSKDYDSRLVEERPAEGYDARLTGYLPYYRNLAVTGAYETWKGDHVGSFGSDNVVQKNPTVWSYGMEWTPVPAFSFSVEQRHSGRHTETLFGLAFTYNFGMDWKDQLTPSIVTAMRTVNGSRHDFVNRQNEMILEYRAKESAYTILFLRTLDPARNLFEFEITDGFGKAVPGQAVGVSADSGVVVRNPSTGLAASQFNTDTNGRMTIQLLPQTDGAAAVTLTAGKTSRTFYLDVVPLENLTLAVAAGDYYIGDEVPLTVNFKDAAGQDVSGVLVAWTLVPDPTPGAVLTPDASPSVTNASGQATAQVKSAIAQTLTVKVTATVNGVDYAAEAQVEIKVNPHGLSLSAASGYVGDDVPLTANFKDGNGQEVSGVLLNWTLVPDPTPGAVLTPDASPSVTDAGGQATAQVKSAIAQTLTVKVTATVNGVDYEKMVDVSVQAPILILTPDSGQHLINSTVALTFTMAGPAAVDNQTVTWSTSDGWLSSMTSVTDSGGLATVDLTGPPDIQGPVTVRATLDNGQYVEAQVSFGTLRGIITVKPQAGSSDIVPSGGSTVLEARIIDPQFDDGTGEIDYTGSLGGLRLNWGKSGEYVFSQTGASASPPSGVSPTNALVAPLFSSSVTPTDANGLATVTFAPGISYGTAGGVQIKAELAAPHSVGGTVNLAVGFDPGWRDNSSPDGWSTACQAAGGTCNSNQSGYQTTTKLPTFEQLLGISINYSRPASLAVTNAQFWTGAASGMGPSSGVVGLDTSVAAWTNSGSTSTRILILR